MEQHDLDERLEALMDNYSILAVLNSLERVCQEKAQYVAEGGSHGEPSAYMAKQWRKVARAIDQATTDAAGL